MTPEEREETAESLRILGVMTRIDRRIYSEPRGEEGKEGWYTEARIGYAADDFVRNNRTLLIEHCDALGTIQSHSKWRVHPDGSIGRIVEMDP